jgi:hypothetical protein
MALFTFSEICQSLVKKFGVAAIGIAHWIDKTERWMHLKIKL